MPIAVSLPVLNHRFHPEADYASRGKAAYQLLPLRFIALDEKRYVASNFAGEHIVLDRESLHTFIRHKLPVDAPIYNSLKSKHFLIDGSSTVALDLLSVKYRTKQELLSQGTSLFLFVVSLRCDHSCPYCQVSRQSADRHAFDMQPDAAARAVDFMFSSPSQRIKVEFQGGEPLLNFELIRQIVLKVKDRNRTDNRDLQFVITSNLVYLTEEVLDFCKEHDVYFSTSLDGPRELHNRNRPRPGGDSYELTIRGIEQIRNKLGHDRVAALMTTTEASLSQPRAIVDEYVKQGFHSIFLRSISPYGFAIKTGQAARYDVEAWLAFYRDALTYILELNGAGTLFREEYTTLLLRKILTPFATGYVDLQSPSGLGISCLVFNYDGDIYASDESRMLAEMGDKTFKLGNLFQNTYEQVMRSPKLLAILDQTMTEGMPMCTDCGFQPYCGSDPVQHYAIERDFVGNKPKSPFCRKNMQVLRHLFTLLEDDPTASEVLNRWI